MKIVFFTWNFPPTVGGIEAVAWHLYRGLSGRGHTVTVVTRGPAQTGEDVSVRRAGDGALAAYLLRAAGAALRACRGDRPDVLLCSTVVGAVPALPLALLWRRPLVVLVHGSDIARPGRLYRAAVSFLLRRAARVCANSTHTRALAEAIGVRASALSTIFPGVEPLPPPAPVASAQVAGWIASGRPILLSVGRLIRRKGVLEFVERVMPSVIRAHPDVLLVVVGEDATQSLAHSREGLRDRIEQAVRALHLEANVALAGRLGNADLYALLRAARMLVMPVRPTPGDVEGFGIVFLEAALAGLPVVATRIGGISDAVVDGVTGLLTNPGDDAAVAAAVLRLLADPGRARSLGEAGRGRVLRELTWDRITRCYEDVLVAAVRETVP